MTILLAVIVSVLLLQIACGFAVALVCFYRGRRWFAAKEQAALNYIEVEKQNLAATLRAFTESPSDTEPSPLAVLVDQFAIVFAGRIMQQLSSRLAQSASAVSQEGSAEQLQGLGAGSPWAALAMAILPKKYRKMLMSTPQFVGAFSNLTGAAGVSAGGDHGNKGYSGQNME